MVLKLYYIYIEKKCLLGFGFSDISVRKLFTSYVFYNYAESRVSFSFGSGPSSFYRR